MTAAEVAEEVAAPGSALADFNDGFTAGYRGAPREKGRSAHYRNAYDRGREASARERRDWVR